MSELEILVKALVDLSKISAEPGQKCHMLATNIDFIRKKITIVLNSKVKK